jgi:hypothetical protein
VVNPLAPAKRLDLFNLLVGLGMVALGTWLCADGKPIAGIWLLLLAVVALLAATSRTFRQRRELWLQSHRVLFFVGYGIFLGVAWGFVLSEWLEPDRSTRSHVIRALLFALIVTGSIAIGTGWQARRERRVREMQARHDDASALGSGEARDGL